MDKPQCLEFGYDHSQQLGWSVLRGSGSQILGKWTQVVLKDETS